MKALAYSTFLSRSDRERQGKGPLAQATDDSGPLLALCLFREVIERSSSCCFAAISYSLQLDSARQSVCRERRRGRAFAIRQVRSPTASLTQLQRAQVVAVNAAIDYLAIQLNLDAVGRTVMSTDLVSCGRSSTLRRAVAPRPWSSSLRNAAADLLQPFGVGSLTPCFFLSSRRSALGCSSAEYAPRRRRQRAAESDRAIDPSSS